MSQTSVLRTNHESNAKNVGKDVQTVFKCHQMIFEFAALKMVVVLFLMSHAVIFSLFPF